MVFYRKKDVKILQSKQVFTLEEYGEDVKYNARLAANISIWKFGELSRIMQSSNENGIT